MSARIDEFLEEYKDKAKELSDQDFESYKKAVLVENTKKYINLEE